MVSGSESLDACPEHGKSVRLTMWVSLTELATAKEVGNEKA